MAPLPHLWGHNAHMDEDVDVLGEPWVARTISLRSDAVASRTGISPVATLVHERETDPARVGVLYIHGFVDYFFHKHLAEPLSAAGFQLYGLDLRDCGRSIQPGRPSFAVDHLALYAEDIDRAVKIIRRRHQQIVIIAHSAGGLVASLWADARPGVLSALVLNAPWFDLRGGKVQRTVATWGVDVLGALRPNTVISHLNPHYGRALHQETGGEWDYNLAWKPHDSPPVTAGYVRTIRRSQTRLARGLWIDCPTLVLASDRTGADNHEHDELLTSDCVLDVADMEHLAPRLGADVTFHTVHAGAHDLALSPQPARDEYLAAVVKFLQERVEVNAPTFADSAVAAESNEPEDDAVLGK